MKKFIIVIAAMGLAFTAANAQSYKFAHVNYQELVYLVPEADSARAQMNSASQEAQETLQAMAQEFDTKYSQYEQKANEWTPAIRQSKERELSERQSKERELSEIQSRIQDFQQSIQQELRQLENQLMSPIYQKVQETVNSLAKAGGYIYVFDSTSLLYIDAAQSTDLTPEARTTLGIPADKTMESLQAELQAQAAAAGGQQ